MIKFRSRIEDSIVTLQISMHRYFVRLGEHDTRTTSDGAHEDVMIAHFGEHASYKTYMYDIAVLSLVRDVDFNGKSHLIKSLKLIRLFSHSFSSCHIDRISPICLPIFGDLLNRRFDGSTPFSAGWGKLKENGEESPVLMQVQVPIVKNELCGKLYARSNEFDDRVICAGFMEGGKDTCEGDSGGPLMLPIAGENGTFPFYQIGIVSWGSGCARPNRPGVYTNVQYYAKWIERKISY